jgi:hypothetical protein
MGLLFTAAGVAACLVGNTGGSVASILWTASRLSLFGLMLLQLAGLGLCFFAILACAALRLRDARVLLPHDRASQRRLFCCGELCPRAAPAGLWSGRGGGGGDGDGDETAAEASLDEGEDAGKDEGEDAAGVGGASAAIAADASAGAAGSGLTGKVSAWLGELSQLEFMVGPMGAVNAISALSQWYATPPARTPPLLQALLPVVMIVASPPLSKLLLRDRKVYTAFVPAAAIGLVAASVAVSMPPLVCKMRPSLRAACCNCSKKLSMVL